MQRQGLLALLASTAIVVVAALAVVLGSGGTVRDAHSGEVVLPGFSSHIGDVAGLKITYVHGGMTLQRKDEGERHSWTIAEKSGYPVDPAKIRQVLLGFAELKLIEAKTRKKAFYSRLDVEDPGTDRGKEYGHSRGVEITDAKGAKLADLIVGKRRSDELGTGNDGLYIRRPGDDQAWLAQGNVDIPAEPKDWLDRKVVSIAPSRIKQVTLTHVDGSTLVFHREKETDKFTVEGAPADAKFKSDRVVSEPANVLDGLELSDVRSTSEMPPPTEGASMAEWRTFDGLTISGTAFEKDGTPWLTLTVAGSDDKSRKEAEELDAKLKPWTFAVYKYKTDAMATKLADLLEAPKGS